jgi:hypothetical protein
MTHASGNVTWQDYPAGTTKITAARLENTEAAFDRLYNSEYAGISRTKRAVFRAHRTTNWVISGDTYVTTGWTVTYDTESKWVVPGGATASYYLIPYSGRVWDLYFKFGFSGIAGNNAGAAKIGLAQDVFQSIGSDSRFVINGETQVMAFRPSVPLTAGDKIYFAGWCSTGVTVPPTMFGGVVPEMVVRDAGPF